MAITPHPTLLFTAGGDDLGNRHLVTEWRSPDCGEPNRKGHLHITAPTSVAQGTSRKDCERQNSRKSAVKQSLVEKRLHKQDGSNGGISKHATIKGVSLQTPWPAEQWSIWGKKEIQFTMTQQLGLVQTSRVWHQAIYLGRFKYSTTWEKGLVSS